MTKGIPNCGIFRKFNLIVFFSFVLSVQSGLAQDFMMQGWYWDYPKTCDGFSWVDTLDQKVLDLQEAGFTYLWLPPLSRASFGNCSNGYDPKDLYDLGEFGLGPTGFGSRAQLDQLISKMNAAGIAPVADVVYNHRDGGEPEDNPSVQDYITTHFSVGKNPFPSDRFRCILPLGGTSGNGAGDYYFKISSKTGDAAYTGKPYVFYSETSQVSFQGLPPLSEAEPNGGGDCGEPSDTAQLGVDMVAAVDGTGCFTDEFKLTITTSDFLPTGDTLFVYLTNQNGDYSDHRVYGIWNASAAMDVVNQLTYQTYTDFSSMPSGQGAMNFENFKPNTGNSSTTSLTGDWDWLWFFYDYDQNIPDTKTKLFDWTKWLWNDVNIRGLRMDAIKHFDPAFVGDLMDDLHDNGIDPDMVVGEFFDSNPLLLKNWLDDVRNAMDADTEAAIKVKIFDFALRQSLKDACDAFGYDVRNVFQSGVVDDAGDSGFHVVSFVNNHDFRDAGQAVQMDPMLAYAYILTNNQLGVPSVFYPDYYGVSLPHGPTQYLKPEIDQLMQIQQDYILNSNSVDYLSRFATPYTSNYASGFENTTLLYQLSGGVAGKEVLVAINFAGVPLQVNHTINMSNLAIGDTLIDLTGNASSALMTINSMQEVTIDLPPRSYAVWVNSGCLPNLTLNQIPVADGNYEVSDFIHSKGLIMNGTDVRYQAGNYIDLLPGFEADLGSMFLARIDGCNP